MAIDIVVFPINSMVICPYSYVNVYQRVTMNNAEELLSSGKRLQKTMENHHAINGKHHYFYGHVQ